MKKFDIVEVTHVNLIIVKLDSHDMYAMFCDGSL